MGGWKGRGPKNKEDLRYKILYALFILYMLL